MLRAKAMRRWLVLLFCLFACAQPIAKTPKRIVSLAPSITEIIFALGCGNNLKGNTTYCDYPEAAKLVYKVGDFSNPSLERIVALKPEIVFATLPEQKIIVDKLQKLGIRVFISQPKDLDAMLQEIKAISQLLKVCSKGDSLVQSLKNEIQNSIANRQNPVPVYLEISSNPLITVGGSSFINDVINKAGGKNIFSDLSQEYPIVSQEEIIKRNPSVIFILHPLTKQAEVKKRLGWQKITAVAQGKIYDDINPDLIFRPGPRIGQGIKTLAQRIQRTGK